MYGFRKFCQCVGVVLFFFYSSIHRGPYQPNSRSNWTQGYNCFSMVSIQVFLRKRMAARLHLPVSADFD